MLAVLILAHITACETAPTTTSTLSPAPSNTSAEPRSSPSPTARPNLALDSQVEASREILIAHPAGDAVDGSSESWWDTGGFVPQWIEVDLGRPSEIGMVRLITKQSIAGETRHELWGKSPQGEYALLHEFGGITQDGSMLDFLPSAPLQDIQFIKVQTVSSTGFVAWREIEIISPGAVAGYLATPTPGTAVVIEDLRIETPDDQLVNAFYYVEDFWPQLIRSGSHTSAFPLPGDFVVPGGFFDWFFYWDSYFILTGLVVQGEWSLAKGIVDNFIALIDEYGYVPNYVAPETVCESRSQPPYLTAAIQEVYVYVQDPAWLEQAYRAAKREYEGYWTAEPHLVPQTGLSRYYDETGVGCVTTPDTRHFRAVAESGWDNSPRFGENASQVLPVDLNSQLYRYEIDLAKIAENLRLPKEARVWQERADRRRALIETYFWDEGQGFFMDYDLANGRMIQGTPRCLSGYVPMWAGVVSDKQAARLVENLDLFETEHGLASCEPGWYDNTQHNYPVGWAYSHWYVMHGLRQYGYHEEATRIAHKWAGLVADRLGTSGSMWEKYNVVDPALPPPGRYATQVGFGWTNGVYAAGLVRILFGVEPDWLTGELRWDPQLPEEWEGADASISLPEYPYPGGISVSCRDWPATCVVIRGTQ